jgi:hypothetical protein
MRAALAALVLSCACAVEPAAPDAAPGDAGRDAALTDARPAARDAWAEIDVGPPVLPAQSWTLTLDIESNAGEATLRLEPRAEAGTVRVIASASGMSSSALFDVQGGHLVGLSTLVIGGPAIPPCGLTRVELRRPVLDFDDRDGDGIHETLRNLSVLDDVVVIRADGRVTTPAMFGTLAAIPDTIPPRFTIDADAELAPGPPLLVHASEAIDPAVLFHLVGPTTYTFDAETDGAAPAHWTLDTSSLLPGHYTFEVPVDARDLAGLAAADSDRPTLAFDVREPFVHPLDAIDARVVSYTSASEISVLPPDTLHDEAIFSATRLVAAVDLAQGTHVLSFQMRIAAPDATRVLGALTIHGPDGSRTGMLTAACRSLGSAAIPGFAAECTVGLGAVEFVAAVGGRYSFELDGSTIAQPCGSVRPSDTTGIALESLRITP